MKLRILLLALIALPLSLFGTTVEELASAVMQDLADRDAHPLADVTYVVNETQGETDCVYRVKRIGRWQTQHTLLMMNGYSSYEKQVTEFAKARNNPNDDYPSWGEVKDRWLNLNRLTALVVPGTLAVATSADNPQVYMTFACKAPVAGSEPVALKGTLVFDKSSGLVSSIQFVNDGPFKTPRGRVDSFTETLTFSRNAFVGMTVPTSIRWSVKGKKNAFSALYDEYSSTMSDYAQ